MKKQSKAARVATASDELVQRATFVMQNGRPNEAERMLRELLSNGRRSPSALQALGLALLAQRRPSEAIAPFEEAARHGPNPVIETNLAIALDKSGRTAEALPWLERATSRQPPFAHAFRELGALLCALQRLDEAEAVLKRGLDVAPNSAELSIVLGGLYLERAERDNAKLAFARALVNTPGHPGALHGLGAALMQEGDFSRAAERFQQALMREPTDPDIHLNLGACLLELGRSADGLASLRSAAQFAPTSYAKALKVAVTCGRGRFWLKPSAASKSLRPARIF